jgi:ribonuclease HI
MERVRGNPGPGGWGAILMYDNHKKEISGYNPETTNNIMEITAVLEAVKLLKFPCDVKIYSDSAYVVNCFNQKWIYSWQKNNWRTADKKPVKNQELWQELFELLQKHNYEFIKVKGHSDNELNNRCDFLATNEIKENA